MLWLCAVSARDPSTRVRCRMHCFSRHVHACGRGTEACRQALGMGWAAACGGAPYWRAAAFYTPRRSLRLSRQRKRRPLWRLLGAARTDIRALMSVPSQIHRGSAPSAISIGQAGRTRAASNFVACITPCHGKTSSRDRGLAYSSAPLQTRAQGPQRYHMLGGITPVQGAGGGPARMAGCRRRWGSCTRWAAMSPRYRWWCWCRDKWWSHWVMWGW